MAEPSQNSSSGSAATASSNQPSWRAWALGAGLVIVGLWGAWWFVAPALLHGVAREAQTGEMFGSFDALFSGLAFAGLIVALFLQRDELRLQREELQSTRKVMQEQQEQLEQQATSTRLQVFEGTFFNLLSLLRQIVRDLPEGEKFFQRVRDDIVDKPVLWNQDNGDLVRFDDAWRTRGAELIPFFRVLDQAYEFASRRADDSEFYLRLLEAQLTTTQRIAMALATCGGRVPPELAHRLHRRGVFVDLNNLRFGDHLAVPLKAWLDEQRAKAQAPHPGG